MKTELIEVSQTARELTIEIEPERVKEVYKKISQKFAKFASVPGFRKGFAPVEIVRIHYKDEIKESVLEDLIKSDVVAALEQLDIHPISEPKVTLENYQSSKLDGSEKATFKLFFEVMPDVPIPDSSDIELVRRVQPVTEEMVNTVIDSHREKEKVFLPVESRRAQEGDTVLVDLEGVFIDGIPSEKIELEDVEILLGDKSIDKAFSENLIGVEEDETREFVIEYPKDYSAADLAGRKVKYTARVKAVGRVELPELTDEWAREHGFESVADMHKKIEERLKKSAEDAADAVLEEEMLNKLTMKYKFEVPSTLVSHQAMMLLSDILRSTSGNKIDNARVDDRLLQQLHRSLLPKVENRLRKALLLGKLIDTENFEPTEEEIEKEINKIAEKSNITPEEVKKWLNQENRMKGLKDNLKERKAIKFLLGKARITQGEWQEKAAEDKAQIDEKAKKNEEK